MTGEHRLSLSPIVAAIAVLSVLLIGVAGTYLIMRGGSSPPTMAGMPGASSSAPAPTATPSAAASAGAEGVTSPRSDVGVTLSKEAVDRAGIEVTSVATESATEYLRLPGVVEPNAYRQVAVTPLVGGRVVSVAAQLGDRVKRGQVLAKVYSPELADARTKYVAAKAMLDAHDRELQRTQKLVEIGAASRQELERIHAEHAAQTAEVESARSRLRLLGAASEGPAADEADVEPVTVVAPIEGVVTERVANSGLNVDATSKLFTILDLSNVWVVGDVYEKDLSHVRVGAPVTVTTAAAYPGLSLHGRVNYIDPQLDTNTRTAKARIEVENPRGELRLGMFTEVAIDTGSSTAVASVPKAAVQNVADRQVVYVAVPGEPAKFLERDVRLGRSSSDTVEIVTGLNAGDSVVSKGSFFLRAEVERLGLRAAADSGVTASAPPLGTSTAAEVQTAKITVTEKGYEPDKVTLRAGVPARLTVVRMTDKTCGTEIVFPTLSIKRALPLNEPVVIEFTPAKTGEISFACWDEHAEGRRCRSMMRTAATQLIQWVRP